MKPTNNKISVSATAETPVRSGKQSRYKTPRTGGNYNKVYIQVNVAAGVTPTEQAVALAWKGISQGSRSDPSPDERLRFIRLLVAEGLAEIDGGVLVLSDLGQMAAKRHGLL